MKMRQAAIATLLLGATNLISLCPAFAQAKERLIELHARRSGPSAIIRVDDDYIFGSQNAALDFTINLLTYYPSFTSIHDQKNKYFGMDCAGYCGGRILISITNPGDELDGGSEAVEDVRSSFQDKLRLSRSDVRVNTEIKSAYDPIISEFEINVLSQNNKEFLRSDRYIVFRRSDKNGIAAMQCSLLTTAKLCNVSFSPYCMKSLIVTIHGLPAGDIGKYNGYVSDTDRYVSGLIRSGSCERK